MSNHRPQPQRKQPPKKKKKKKSGFEVLLGNLALLLFTLISIFFVVSVLSTKLLPTHLAIVLVAIVVVLNLLIWLLAGNPRRHGGRAAGLVLATIFAVSFALGIYYIQATFNTWDAISTGGNDTVSMSVYFLAEDDSELEDVAGEYTFATLSIQNQDALNAAVEQLNQEYSVTLNTASYDSITQQVDALFTGEADALLVDSSYIPLLEDMSGYETAADQLRLVKTLQISVSQKEVENGGTVSHEGNTFTVYISGSDSRDISLSAKGRSDVNILATVNLDTRQVLLVSTPRDFYVPLAIDGTPLDKLTHAGIYGVQTSMDTLSDLYDTQIDYFFRVNFAGFVNIIDALGGITVNSDYAFTAYATGERFQKGENYLNGTEALAFARERHAFPDGDRQRGKNQMEVIRAVAEKAMSPQLLSSYLSLLDAVEGSFETSVPYDLITQAVRDQLNGGGEWNIVTVSADGLGSTKYCYSLGDYASVVLPDEETVTSAKKMIDQVYAGEIITQP